MTHQTGIGASEGLSAYLKGPAHKADRCIKINIENEELRLDQHRMAASCWASDWDRNVLACIEDQTPCYLLYRLDNQLQSSGDYQYVFMLYMPIDARVKDKMLFAATQSTLKRIFGDNKIIHEMNGSTPDELCLLAYKNHVNSLSLCKEAVMTEEERELNEVSKNEAMMRCQMESNRATLPGLNLPTTVELNQSLEKFKKGFINYIQIKLDVDKEELKLWDCSNIQPTELSEKIPADEPRYHLFNFNHTFEGENQWAAVFVYSCPSCNIPVKQRMMYSSTKASFLACLQQMEIELKGKTEISEGDEIKENDIFDLVHPQKHVSRPQLVKPKAPSKGGRRLIRK